MPKLKNNLPNKYLINLANKLSEINQFETFPNPCVGAVGIDKNNHIHLAVTGKNGSPHAEFALLKNKKINFINELYTSLEPCCHIGKNPSCSNLIIKKKVKKIFSSSIDLDERVKGKTNRLLKKKNISLKYTKQPSKPSVLHNYCNLNQKPYVVAKIASSNDFYSKHKFKRLFTSTSALKFAHLLRYQYDSILVGKNTINHDNPSLNCRLNGIEKKIAIFIINKNLFFNKKVFLNNNLKGAYVFHSEKNKTKIKKVGKFFKLIYFDLNQPINDLLKIVYRLGYKKLLIEGGANTLSNFLKSKCINELYHVKNKLNFNKNGLLNIKKIIKNNKLPLNQVLNLEQDLILNYKSKYVHWNY